MPDAFAVLAHQFAVLAHQGGWDEVLIVGVVVALFGVWKLWERRRGKPKGPHKWDRHPPEAGADQSAGAHGVARSGDTEPPGHTGATGDAEHGSDGD